VARVSRSRPQPTNATDTPIGAMKARMTEVFMVATVRSLEEKIENMGRAAIAAVFTVLSLLGPHSVQASEGQTSKAGNKASSADGEVRKLPNGAILRLAPGTRIALARPIKVQLGSRPEQTLAQSVQLISGRVEVELPASKNPTAGVLIQAPFKISAVAKGGRSVVIAGAKGVTVAAISGEMLAASGNDWRTLPTGMVREYAQGGATSDHGLLPAPRTTVSAPVALSLGDKAPIALNAGATPVPRAASYEFGLWSLKGSERKLLKRLSAKDGSVQLGELPAGSYAVSSHAVEASGLEGAESDATPLRVVAAELPDGARLTGDGILLPPHQRVKLKGVEGIEVSYGRAPNFVAAPNTIGLIRGETTLVRVRAVGSKDELALTLAPRTIKAEIQMGPARARWPQDPVKVSVRLSDSRGRPLAADVVAKAKVFVNVNPVDVDWKREGDQLTAVVLPAEGAGPWVVRTEVTDDTGAVVGHNFLEIAPNAAQTRR
jgi:hypothetical protein